MQGVSRESRASLAVASNRPSGMTLRSTQRIMLWLAEAFHKSLLQTPSLLKKDWVMYTCWSVHVSVLSYKE